MHGPQSIRPIEDLTAESERADGAAHIARDCAGLNFYEIDRGLRDLLPLYLADGDYRQLAPHFHRLGRLAGGRLDELARIADKNPPVLHARDRFGRDEDWIDYHPAYREMESIAFGDFQFHAMSHRGGALGASQPLPAVAKYALQYLFVQAEFGLMCPISVTDTSIHLIRKFAKRGTEGLSAAKNAFGRACDAVEGHAVHDRTRRRLRRRRDRDGGAAGRRRLAAHRRQMVLFARRCRRGAAAGAPRGSAARYKRACAVRLAAAAEGRPAQFLQDRASQGQARHPLDGVGRNSPGRRRRLSRRRKGSRPQADDGAGQFIEALAWRPRRGHDAALRERGDDIGADAHRLWRDDRQLSPAAPPAFETHRADRAGAVDDAVCRKLDGPGQCRVQRMRKAWSASSRRC